VQFKALNNNIEWGPKWLLNEPDKLCYVRPVLVL